MSALGGGIRTGWQVGTGLAVSFVGKVLLPLIAGEVASEPRTSLSNEVVGPKEVLVDNHIGITRSGIIGGSIQTISIGTESQRSQSSLVDHSRQFAPAAYLIRCTERPAVSEGRQTTLLASYMRTVSFEKPAVATRPLVLNAKAFTALFSSPDRATSRPLVASNSRDVPSSLAVATHCPSELNANRTFAVGRF
jgi:hypothetical protein